MSNNTNTLFWVITGAVIVLAVFILINNSQSNSINKINNKFDAMWEEVKDSNRKSSMSNILSFGEIFNYKDLNIKVLTPWISNNQAVFNVQTQNLAGQVRKYNFILRIYDEWQNLILEVTNGVESPFSGTLTTSNLVTLDYYYYARYWSIEMVKVER